MRHGHGNHADTAVGRVYFETEGAGPAVFVVPDAYFELVGSFLR